MEAQPVSQICSFKPTFQVLHIRRQRDLGADHRTAAFLPGGCGRRTTYSRNLVTGLAEPRRVCCPQCLCIATSRRPYMLVPCAPHCVTTNVSIAAKEWAVATADFCQKHLSSNRVACIGHCAGAYTLYVSFTVFDSVYLTYFFLD